MATINCRDCGQERTRCPSNTRYCKPCRLLRMIDYWRTRRKHCMTCQAAYAPLDRGDMRCALHADDELRTKLVHCVLCREDAHPLITGIPVCFRCLRSPTKRLDLYDALRRGQRERKDRNSATA